MTLQSMGTAAPAGADETSHRIAELAPWFHNLHLPDGRCTAPDHPLGDFPAFKWHQLAGSIPAELAGTTALDIGCNAGYYSFQLAARGARVLAIDHDEHYLEQGRWAARLLDPHGLVEFRRMGVYDLASLPDRFDLVLFLGVLYHLRHPQLALDIVAERVGGRLVFQTLTMPASADALEVPDDLPLERRDLLTAPGWPRAAFIEHSLAGDPTNWWALDDACVRAMLRSAGLQVIGTPGHELYVCEPAAAGDPATPWRQAELAAVLGCCEGDLPSPPG
jgi:tRNA (mo5U34)-methyltransferase